MENIAPIQIAEPKREKRAAVTAAYRRGYADALEDMRKRQREKKRRRQYFIMQKLNGIALLAFTALAVYILEGDATIAILTVPLPVGNLTSQLFANIYLNKLDQYAKHTLGVGMYVRYMDDFIILSPDKEKLRYWLAEIERFLRDELRLELNPKTTILAAKNGIDFVGYKHRATHRKVRPDSIKRIKKTIKKYERGKITKEQLQKSIQSWTGHAGHADSYNLRKKIIILAQAAEKKGGSIS